MPEKREREENTRENRENVNSKQTKYESERYGKLITSGSSEFRVEDMDIEKLRYNDRQIMRAKIYA